MSSLLCKCGNVIYGTDCPSDSELFVYTEKEIQAAIAYNPDIRWFDFILNRDALRHCKRLWMLRPTEVEYWYCQECKRVYEVDAHTGNFLRLYKRMQDIPKDSEIVDMESM